MVSQSGDNVNTNIILQYYNLYYNFVLSYYDLVTLLLYFVKFPIQYYDHNKKSIWY